LVHNNHLREAQYIKISEKKKDQKNHAKMIQRIVSSLVVLFCFGFLIMGGAKMISATSFAYVLTVDGEQIATLVSESEAKQAIDLCLKNSATATVLTDSGLQVDYRNDVEIEKVSATGVVYSSVSETADMLSARLDIVADATAIRIDGKSTLYVADDNQAIAAINAAKNYYADPKVDPTVLRVYTSEEISLTDAKVNLDKVLSQKQATNMLLFGSRNAQSTGDPLITVNVERTTTETEVLAYTVVKQENTSLSRGQEKVISEGVDGIQEVTYKVREINGVLVGSEPISNTVVEAAIDEVVEVGTQYYIASRSNSGGQGTLGWPCDGMITSRFGPRARDYHTGIDVASPVGTTLFAAEKGTVSCAQYESGYGNVIRIDHGDGMETVYAHCDDFYVEVGDTVDRNTAIAAIGMTGTTTGPHVHFEVRIDGQAVNPLDYLEY